MKIQSLSIHVPTKGCINNCKFCVSPIHDSPYEDRIGRAIRDVDHKMNDTTNALIEYQNRLHFAKENGVNTVILTGIGEPLQNISFIEWFSTMNRHSYHPFNFHWIELQTSGNLLLNNVKVNGREISVFRFLKDVGVSTISF